MAPHSIETILRPPQWPVALSNFVTWCLMWDPRNRPTSAQAMEHEYFADAIDPLKSRSSTSRLLGRKHSGLESKPQRDSSGGPHLSSKPSWFRSPLFSKDSGPPVPSHDQSSQIQSPRPSPIHANTVVVPPTTIKSRPFASKRATWTNTTMPVTGAPMPILPSIRPISPFSDAVTAQANIRPTETVQACPTDPTEQSASKKIGRQLSVASNGNHYADYHRQEAERALNGHRDVTSPGGTQKEGFFSHLRKRARRLSGRPQGPMSPTMNDIEANAGCAPCQNNRESVNMDSGAIDPIFHNQMNPGELDKALQSPSNAVYPSPASSVPPSHKSSQAYGVVSTSCALERHPSTTKSRGFEGSSTVGTGVPTSNRARRVLQQSTNPSQMYETPDEEDELLHEALHSASKAAKGMDCINQPKENHRAAMAQKDVNQQYITNPAEESTAVNPYPTPSPSARRNGVQYTENLLSEPAIPLHINRSRPKEELVSKWPTPPYEENEWAAAAAASIVAAGTIYR